MSVSRKAKQMMARLECYAMFPYLIEVTLANGEVYRYANADKDITFDDEGTKKVFNSGWFSIDSPNVQETEIGNGSITISSIDQFWIGKIRDNKRRARIRFVASIVYDDDDNIEQVESIEDTEYTLVVANWDETTITWDMIFDENQSVVMPLDVATSTKVSGVY